tara:strand:+ start:1382 stop:2341 length:960 start_codon:yes stop_codon:yes gene_type:complete
MGKEKTRKMQNDEVWNNFDTWVKKYKSEDNTAYTYNSGVRKFLDELDKPFYELSDDQLIRRMKNYASELRRSTHRKYSLRWLLEFSGKSNLYNAIRESIKIHPPPRRQLKKDIDFHLIHKFAKTSKNLNIKNVIMLQYDAASRIGALIKIQLKHLGQDDDGMDYIVLNEKGGNTRTVYMSQTTSKYVKELSIWAKKNTKSYKLKDVGEKLLFQVYYDRAKINPYTRGLLNDDKLVGKTYRHVYKKLYDELLKESMKILGFKLTSHWFRHSRIIHLTRKGYSMEDMQKFTGHKDLNALRRYRLEAGIESKEMMKRENPKW